MFYDKGRLLHVVVTTGKNTLHFLAFPGRVRACWVKGHATWRDVGTGVTTWADRVGNNCADDLANRGAEVHLTNSPELRRARLMQKDRRSFTMRHQQMLLNIVKEWEGAVSELPWLYSSAVPNPFDPQPEPRRPGPGSFARRQRRRIL